MADVNMADVNIAPPPSHFSTLLNELERAHYLELRSLEDSYEAAFGPLPSNCGRNSFRSKPQLPFRTEQDVFDVDCGKLASAGSSTRSGSGKRRTQWGTREDHPIPRQSSYGSVSFQDDASTAHAESELHEMNISRTTTNKAGTTYRVSPGWDLSKAGAEVTSMEEVVGLNYRTTSQNVVGLLAGKENDGKRWFVIRPSCRFRVVWDFFGLLLISYDLLTIPFSQAFQTEGNGFTDCADWITLVFWTFDLIQGFFVGYFLRGELVLEHKSIVKNYLRTWFIVDMIVVVPEWAMILFVYALGSYSNTNVWGIGRVAKIVRVARVLRLLRLLKLKQFLNFVSDRIESEYTFIVFNLMQLLFFVLVLNHLIACAWYSIGRIAGEHGLQNWITHSDLGDYAFVYLYATSLHWSLTQFTPASMEVVAKNWYERFFTISIVLFAMLVFSSIVGSVTSSVTALRNVHGDEMRQFWLLRKYLRQRGIPVALSKRIIKFLEHHCQVQSRLVQKEKVPVLKHLSEALQNELTFHIHSRQLVAHPFFEHLNGEMPPVMHRLCRLVVSVQCYGENESAFDNGDEAKFMYFVKCGVLHYTRNDMETKQPTQWLSEPVLYTMWRHKGALVAQTESELLTVDPEAYMSVMKVHPRPWTYAFAYALKVVELLNSGHIEWSDLIFNDDLHSEEAMIAADVGLHSHGENIAEWSSELMRSVERVGTDDKETPMSSEEKESAQKPVPDKPLESQEPALEAEQVNIWVLGKDTSLQPAATSSGAEDGISTAINGQLPAADASGKSSVVVEPPHPQSNAVQVNDEALVMPLTPVQQNQGFLARGVGQWCSGRRIPLRGATE